MNSLHRLFTAKGAGLITRSSYLQMVGCPLAFTSHQGKFGVVAAAKLQTDIMNDWKLE